MAYTIPKNKYSGTPVTGGLGSPTGGLDKSLKDQYSSMIDDVAPKAIRNADKPVSINTVYDPTHPQWNPGSNSPFPTSSSSDSSLLPNVDMPDVMDLAVDAIGGGLMDIATNTAIGAAGGYLGSQYIADSGLLNYWNSMEGSLGGMGQGLATLGANMVVPGAGSIAGAAMKGANLAQNTPVLENLGVEVGPMQQVGAFVPFGNDYGKSLSTAVGDALSGPRVAPPVPTSETGFVPAPQEPQSDFGPTFAKQPEQPAADSAFAGTGSLAQNSMATPVALSGVADMPFGDLTPAAEGLSGVDPVFWQSSPGFNNGLDTGDLFGNVSDGVGSLFADPASTLADTAYGTVNAGFDSAAAWADAAPVGWEAADVAAEGATTAIDAAGTAMDYVPYAALAFTVGDHMTGGKFGETIASIPVLGDALTSIGATMHSIPVVGDIMDVGTKVEDAMWDAVSSTSDFFDSIADGLGSVMTGIGGGGGGCFITTAMAEQLGKPDDCYELTVLRKFRDEYMLSTEQGKAEVMEYYRIAPLIVIMIGNDPEKYAELRAQFILPAIKLIEECENEKAYLTYKEMVDTLKSQY